MHPVTRLGRVIQQLRSFGDLHASEFDALASELDAAGLNEVAAKIRVYRDVQRDEGQLVIDELLDIQGDVLETAEPAVPPPPDTPAAAPEDQWRASPKRAQWLAKQAELDAQARAPRTRREFFGRSQ
jgi:hypothetical protein